MQQQETEPAASAAVIPPADPAPDPAATAKPPLPEGFAARSARGGLIMTATQVAASAITFTSQIVLAWFLLPDDFGTVAVAASISALVAVFRDAGAPAILIQRQHEFDRIAGTVFWMTLGGATLCGLLTAVAGPIVAHVKHNPILLPVMLLTAARFPIGALGTISSVRLAVELKWKLVAATNLVQPLVTAIAAIVMACTGFGVYALVVPPILGDAARAFACWFAAGGHVRLRPDMQLIAGIVVSSVYIVLTNLTLAVRGVGDYLTLSFTRGEHETGLYFYAFIMSQAMGRLALGAAPSVLAPVFSKVKHDESRHADVMIRSMHIFSVFGVLAITMQASMSWALFRLFLNPKWLPAAPLFCIVTLMSLFFLTNVIFQAVWANGLYRPFFHYSIIFTPCMIVLFLIGTWLAGAQGVAWANVIAGAADFIIFPLFAFPLLKVAWRAAIVPLWRPAVAAVPTALVAWLLHHTLPTTRSADILRIVITVTAGTTAYLLILWLVWREVMTEAWRHVSKALGRNR